MKHNLPLCQKEIVPTIRKFAVTSSSILICSTFALVFSNVPVWASGLGTAQISADADSLTCFGGCNSSSEKYASGANSSARTGYSFASNTVVLTPKETSISAYAEADPLSGGHIGSDSFTARALSEVYLDYYFEVTGPQSITLPVLVNAQGSVHVTSQYAGTGEVFSYYARIQIIGAGNYVLNQEIYNKGSDTTVDNRVDKLFGTYQYYDLQSNTPYEVSEVIKSGALYQLPGLTGAGLVSSTVSIDPSFTIDPAYASQYSIQFSDGLDIGSVVSTVPLPSSAPMFGAALLALGMVGYSARRRNATPSA